MKTFYVILILFSSIIASAQKRILVFHETNGFRHTGAINQGINMFEDLGNENGDWITDNSQDSSVFNTSNLEQYDAVVFLNTSGTDESDERGDLLSASEKEAFEDFIASGKGFVGIHAATDTYRNGVWDFYNELVGAIVQSSPNHTSNNYNADLEVINSHPIIDFLGSIGTTWNKDEEYYYWQTNGGQLSNDNTVLLEVAQTGDNPYDEARPITWYKESITYDDDTNDDTPKMTIDGIRSFYTALGHNGSDYSNDTNFRTLLKNAIVWATDTTLSVPENILSSIRISPNPSSSIVRIHSESIGKPIALKLFDSVGRLIITKTIQSENFSNAFFVLNVSDLKYGIYFINLSTHNQSKTVKLLKY